ncbi:serine/threonine-protein kinase PknD [Mycolicibacterium hodleri]|uniref:non-specific serine/threonine protein kinase n=1 Tax=Mycolicibacterium hodleri TaxID=49897 RepID=A0A502EL07_9MYCO|nr:serine/threonine-protein kinase PknD [Mycolicibacterium hodleri]TPG37166.1 serine/threonine protein kinase [Mycolicibacterium hodleri]
MDDTVIDGGDATAGEDSSDGVDDTSGAVPTETFGRYGLLSLLGAGGMGQVWRARDSQTNRVVALKVLPEHSADDDESRERFRRECEAVAQLTEPHIIPIHDFGDVDGRLFLNMRLVDGRDLRTLIKQEGALPPMRAVAIIVQVAGALQAAHDVGLVHRDVKPSNILVCVNDFAYLIDFGIAHASGDATLTKAGETIGTAVYMAPEAIGAAVKTHSRVDVYALTCVLYECLTGQPPFTSEVGMQGLIAHHLHTPPPQPSVTRSEVPIAFDAVIATGMAKNPDDRFDSVQDLAAAARAALEDHPTLPTTEAVGSHARQRIHLSRKAIALLVASIAAVAVVVAGVVIIGRHASDSSSPAASPVGQGYSSQIALPFPEIRVAGGVAVDPAGTAYVTAIGTDRVMRLEVGATAATQLPISGLKNPQDVAVDAKGDVYVTDSSNDRVVWLPAGARAAATLPFTGLNDPRGIIASPAGDVYVVDRGNDRVLFLAAGATTAITLPFTGLNDPRGVAVDASGGVDVTDTGNNRVMRLAPGSTVAQALPFTGLNDPHGVAIDAKGTVYVTDRGNAGIVELRPGATAAIPLPFSGLNDPQGVAVDGAGNLYVTDMGPHPVVKLIASQ